jgi:hypothetical protein
MKRIKLRLSESGSCHTNPAFSHNTRLFLENNPKLLALSNLHPKRTFADQGQSRLIKVNQG